MKVPTAAEVAGSDNLDAAKGTDISQTGVSLPTPRYANLEEFRAEFGDYRVNDKTDNIC